jgi:hypothetical protein
VLTFCRFEKEGILSAMRIGRMVGWWYLITSVHQNYLGHPG